MNNRIESAMETFRYKRTRATLTAWSLGVLTFMLGYIVLNMLSTYVDIPFIQNPWFSTLGILAVLALAVVIYTLSLDSRLRKALSEFDFILEEQVDPEAYLKVLDGYAPVHKRRVSPAYLHARLRGMMYLSTQKELLEFLATHADVLGKSPNVQMAHYRVMDYAEKSAEYAALEQRITALLDRQEARAKSDLQREHIAKQRLWIYAESLALRMPVSTDFEKLEAVQTDTLSNLETVRYSLICAQAYDRVRAYDKADRLYEIVVRTGNTTRFVKEAKKGLESR